MASILKKLTVQTFGEAMIPHVHSKYHRKKRTTTVSTQRSSLRKCLAQHHSWSRPANKIAHVHSLLVQCLLLISTT